jgi:uridine phosphorylase
MGDPYRKEWRNELLNIATGWLFDDLTGDSFPDAVILPFENPDLYDHFKFISRLNEVKNYKSISIGKYKEKYIGVLRSKFGAPAVAMVTDVLASLHVKSILGVGFCGALQKNINSGDLIIPYACIRDDGTTAKYVSENYPAVADLFLLDTLREFAKISQYHWHCGIILSTDAVMLEDSTVLDKWSNRNVIGVDMESGALFIVARLLGIHTASILVASDNPVLNRRADPNKLSIGLNSAIDLAFHTLSKLL